MVLMIVTTLSIHAAKYDDAVPVMKKMIASIESFTVNINKAADGKEIAAAMDQYAKEIKSYAADVVQLMKKYPELKDDKNHPESLKPFTKKFEELSKKLMQLYGKLGKYMDDPDVKAANERMMKAMAAMNPNRAEKGVEKKEKN